MFELLFSSSESRLWRLTRLLVLSRQRLRTRSQRPAVSCIETVGLILSDKFVTRLPRQVIFLQFVGLARAKLLDEVIDAHVAAAYSD